MTWLTAHIEIVAVGLLIMVSGIFILQQRRSPQATVAWLLFVVLLPYVAIPVFITFGFRKRTKHRLQPIDVEGVDTGSTAGQLQHLLGRYGIAAATAGNAFRLDTSGEDAWATVLREIERAEVSLDVTLYVLGNDAVGQAFCTALTRRASSGVRVRLILDSIGSLRRPRRELRALTRAGGEIRYFSPLIHRPFGSSVNLRNHRKMLIRDDTAVWTGGRNVGGEYMGPDPSRTRWRDISFLIEGPAVDLFGKSFRSDWSAAGGASPDHADILATPGHSTLQVLPAGPDWADDPIHDAFVFLTHAARRRITIVTPYFLPTGSLTEALAIAARRGVEVRILVPRTSNQRLADLARGSWMRELDRAGCGLHLFDGGMVHAKAMLFDDIAVTGSANFDARSLLLNFEVMTVLYSPPDVAEIAAWIERLLDVTPPGLPAAGRGRRFVEGLLRLGAPLL